MTFNKIAKAVRAFWFLVICANSLTMLAWAFRYVWFSHETVPFERIEVAMALGFFSFIAFGIAASVITHTTE